MKTYTLEDQQAIVRQLSDDVIRAEVKRRRDVKNAHENLEYAKADLTAAQVRVDQLNAIVSQSDDDTPLCGAV